MLDNATRRMIVLFLAAVLISSHGTVLAEQDENETRAVGALGESIVDFAQRAESTGFCGSVLASKGGVVIAAVGVGHADLDGDVPNTPATLFEIASATKQFTAAAVLVLVQKGRLDLDDPMAKYLDGIPDECKKITVRHLLQHTSGIPGTNSRGSGTDLAAVLPTFLEGGPKHKPGSHWEYWNQGYALLSEIIAQAAKKDYVSFCKEALFAPAGMKATLFTGDAAPDETTVAVGRSARGKPRSALDHPYGAYGFQYRGMGGAVTSVWDLWRWDRALHEDEILGAGAKKELFRPGLKQYALGWYVFVNKQMKQTQSHGGGVRGFVCDVRRYPAEDGFLAVLCNRDDFQAWRIAMALEELLFSDRPKSVKPPRMLDSETAAAIVGRYDDGRGSTLIVKPDGRALSASISKESASKPGSRPPAPTSLGADDDGKIVIYDWESCKKVKVTRKGQSPASVLTIGTSRYKRVDS